MCIICVSPKGVRQPSLPFIWSMFENNPHGAGYMVARNGKVRISKGYMTVEDFLHALRQEHFTAADSVVYHFRISTQAGVCPEMTHPFPLSNRLAHMKELDIECRCGIAHNGIIPLTTDPNNREYSDTALFIRDYLTKILHTPRDLRDEAKLKEIGDLAKSKLAIMDGSGYVATVGQFVNRGGLLFSNMSFEPWLPASFFQQKPEAPKSRRASV